MFDFESLRTGAGIFEVLSKAKAKLWKDLEKLFYTSKSVNLTFLLLFM
jgi:hypothetical protein